MTMTMDQTSTRHLGGSMAFDHLPYASGPHFSNPWGTSGLFQQSSTTPSQAHSQQPSQAQLLPHPQHSSPSQTTTTHQSSRAKQLPFGSSYSTHAGFGGQADLFSNLANGTTTASSYVPTNMSSYMSSYPSLNSTAHRRSVSNTSSNAAAAAGLDMQHVAQGSTNDLITPRNIYGNERSAAEGYGFPDTSAAGSTGTSISTQSHGTHSAHSSISGSSGYTPASSYYAGSVAGSVGDSLSEYGGSQSDMDSVSVSSRTLPRPSTLSTSSAPAPASMMSQFNSKISSSSQKKHKCKICDKRFTRPSSLQTHMYSHTGEKPYACEFAGCGRHFSVVSNLRRHRKVHKQANANGGNHSAHASMSPKAVTQQSIVGGMPQASSVPGSFGGLGMGMGAMSSPHGSWSSEQ